MPRVFILQIVSPRKTKEGGLEGFQVFSNIFSKTVLPKLSLIPQNYFVDVSQKPYLLW